MLIENPDSRGEWIVVAAMFAVVCVVVLCLLGIRTSQADEARLLYCTEVLNDAGSLRDTVHVVEQTSFCKQWTKLP